MSYPKGKKMCLGLTGGLLALLGLMIAGTITALPGCADNVSKETFVSAMENTNQQKGYRVKSETKITRAGYEPLLSKEEIIYQKEGLSYSKSYTQDGNIGNELYQKGNIAVIKNATDQGWRRLDIPSQPSGQTISVALFNLDQMKDCIKKAWFSGAEKINNVECKIIETSMNPRKMQKTMPKRKTDTTKIITMQYKMWIGEKNDLIHKLKIITVLENGQESSGQTTMTYDQEFFDYDKDIEIELPEEVKKLFGDD